MENSEQFKRDVLKRWLLRLLKAETPQINGYLGSAYGFCCLGDLLEVLLEQKLDHLSKKIDRDGYATYSLNGEDEEGVLHTEISEEFLGTNSSAAFKGEFDGKRVKILPVVLNDNRVPKSVIAALIWSFYPLGFDTKNAELKAKIKDLWLSIDQDRYQLSSLFSEYVPEIIKEVESY